MAKRLIVVLSFLLLIALCLLLPPHLFRLADKAMLETPTWEENAGVALNREPLSPAEKVAVLSNDGQSGLSSFKMTAPFEQSVDTVLREVDKLSERGFLPYLVGSPVGYNVETTLYVGGDRSAKMETYYLDYNDSRLTVLYSAEDQKIYGFSYSFYDEALFKTYIDEREEKGYAAVDMENFARYLGVELEEKQDDSNYYSLKNETAGFFCTFQPQPFYAEPGLTVAPMSLSAYTEIASKYEAAGESSYAPWFNG